YSPHRTRPTPTPPPSPYTRSSDLQASAAGATVSSAQAGVTLAEARVKAAQATRDFAALQVQYTHVMTPETGIVSRKQVEVGQLRSEEQPSEITSLRHLVCCPLLSK